MTGIPDTKIREMLAQEFGQFEPHRLNDYLIYLREHAADEANRRAIERIKEKIRNRVYISPMPEPCLVPGCEGKKVFGKPWPWLCSIGGLRHYLAVTISASRDLPVDVVLEQMIALNARSEQEEEAKRQAWQEGVRNLNDQQWFIIEEAKPESIPQTALTETHDRAIQHASD